MSKVDYFKYQSGADYAGAEKLLEKEWSYLEKTRPGFDRNNIKGLALSGGGIRSASFNLGVLQALASRNKLEKFDYLSTVSGGGYLGGSLSWLWSGLWRNRGQTGPSFGVGENDFPYGTQGRRFDGSKQEKESNRQQASLLRHLRQHGKYLTPGKGITAFSFLSILLRSLVMGFVTLMVFAGFLFSLFYLTGIFEVGVRDSLFLHGFAGGMILLGFVGLQLLYMMVLSSQKYGQDLNRDKRQGEIHSTRGYRLRRFFEKWIPLPLIIALLCYVLAMIHWVQVYAHDWAIELGGFSALVGAVLGAMGPESKWRKLLAKLPMNIQFIVAALLMLFGLLVLADFFTTKLVVQFPGLYGLFTSVAALLFVLVAYFLPINNISIHRYYRDRLMETFMPDVNEVLAGEDTGEALRANKTGMHELGLGDHSQAPYHLINANVILVESEIAKFRGRGGDNFILSPLYSGSNATGWRSTREFCDGSVTLPTAVAISGAAANPDAGVAGKGLTINPVISILMSIFNLRLGYWVSNPDPEHEYPFKFIPNYFNPGFVEVFQRRKMNEKAPLLQLSDGGHFENLALYELFRRRARFILVCDAAADPEYQFTDLANAIEKARVDFGVSVDISKEQINSLIPATKPGQQEMDYPLADKSYLVCDINYPEDTTPGTLVYVKTTLSPPLGVDIHGYKRAHPDFPDQTTVDQFFDEVQFEAYRELGWQIMRGLLEVENLSQLG